MTNIATIHQSRLRKSLAALSMAGLLALTLVGCSSGSSSIEETQTTSTPAVEVVCPTAEAQTFGDVTADSVVTDAHGDYCKTKISPDSAALVYDISKVDTATLAEYGFTQEDAEASQTAAVSFFAFQAMDSNRLDSDEFTDADWLAANSDLLKSPELYVQSVDSGKHLSDMALLVADYIPELPRDGGPRASETNIQVNKVYANVSPSGTNIIVTELGVTAKYNASNEAVVDLIVKLNPSKTADSVKAEYPQLAGAEPVNVLLQGTFSYSTAQGSNDLIAGSRGTWNVSTQDGIPIA